MDKCIEILRSIRKDELDERTFYEQVLSALTGLEAYLPNPHDASKLKSVLEEIGCVKYDVWKKEKESQGEPVLDNLEIGMMVADIGAAVNLIEPLLGSYKDAVAGFDKILETDGNGRGAKYWLDQNEWIYVEAPKRRKESFDKAINGLSEIKKEEMDERAFYENVLSNLITLEYVDLTPERAEQLKKTLEDIGCVRYETWEKEKKARGEKTPEKGEERKSGDISIAVNFIHQLLCSHETASYGLSKMLEGGEEAGWAQCWLRASARVRENESEKNASGEEKSMLPIKAEIVEANKIMGTTKNDILSGGKRLFDRSISKAPGKDEIGSGKDEIDE